MKGHFLSYQSLKSHLVTQRDQHSAMLGCSLHCYYVEVDFACSNYSCSWKKDSVFGWSISITAKYLRVDVACLDFSEPNQVEEALPQLFVVLHYSDFHSMVIHYLCLGWIASFSVNELSIWLKDCFDSSVRESMVTMLESAETKFEDYFHLKTYYLNGTATAAI